MLLRVAANCPECRKLEREYKRSMADIDTVIHGAFGTIGEKIYALHCAEDINNDVYRRINAHRRRHFEEISRLINLSNRNELCKGNLVTCVSDGKHTAATSHARKNHSCKPLRFGNLPPRNPVPIQKVAQFIPIHSGEGVKPVNARDDISCLELVQTTCGQEKF